MTHPPLPGLWIRSPRLGYQEVLARRAAPPPIRHRGPAGRRRQHQGAQPSQARPTRAYDDDLDEDLAPPLVEANDDIYFGDFWGHLFRGYIRCALFQFRGFPLAVREAKEHEFLNILRQYRINLAFMQELGLNWSALGDSQQWRKRVEYELDSTETRTRCSHNSRSNISEWRQWGGTGMLAHGLISHFAAGSGGDKTGLGRWTWS